MRLIDADALINSIINNQSTVHGHHEQLEILSIVNRYVVNLIQKAPTVELKLKKNHEGKTYYDVFKEENGREPIINKDGFTECPQDFRRCFKYLGLENSCMECWSKPFGYWRAEE